MTGKLTDGNENVDALTAEELIAAQSAVVKIREKRFTEQARIDAKIAEMKAREAIKIEREERRAATKAQATEGWKEHQRMQRKEKKAGEREAKKIRERERKQKEKLRGKIEGKTAAEKTRVRAEGDAAKAEAIREAREARNRARALREGSKGFGKEADLDYKNKNGINALKRNLREMTRRGDLDGWKKKVSGEPMYQFIDTDPTEMLDRIIDDRIQDTISLIPLDILMATGLRILDDEEMLAVACDHPEIMEKLECGRGYQAVLLDHPQMVEPSRSVWFGDAPTRCVIFSLPIEGEE